MKKIRNRPNRTWPVEEKVGWQHLPEFFAQFPTRNDRRKFYESRRDLYVQMRAEFRERSRRIAAQNAALSNPAPLSFETKYALGLAGPFKASDRGPL